MSIHMLFTNILPEAICCCLETCNVYVVCVQTFMATTANIRYLQVHLAYL